VGSKTWTGADTTRFVSILTAAIVRSLL